MKGRGFLLYGILRRRKAAALLSKRRVWKNTFFSDAIQFGKTTYIRPRIGGWVKIDRKRSTFDPDRATSDTFKFVSIVETPPVVSSYGR